MSLTWERTRSVRRLQTKQISVATVDVHATVADGLALIVSAESDFELAGLAASVAEALTLIEHQTPDSC